MSGTLQDVRFAIRQLLKNRTFSAIAVLTLALGIGANTAIFSVVNGVLLRPLPFQDPDRVVRVWHTPPAKSFPGMSTFAVSAANYLDWRSENHAFEQMAIYNYRGLTLTGTAQPQQVDACAVSSGFFETLGVRPMLGRIFSREEDQPGHTNVVILSNRFWQEQFGSNPDIVGRNATMDGKNYLVAGVMPASFRFPDFAQAWTPMGWTDKERAVRGEHHSAVIARLKPGVDLKHAQAEMSTISGRLEQQYPADDKGWGALVVPLQQDLVSDVRPALLVLLGAVAFVLLIACANVANLVLARTFSRQKEIAIRTALGASGVRVLRQILTESVMLAVIGGALGLVVAHFGQQLILSFLAKQLPASVVADLDLKVLAFTACISVLTGILAGALPALRLSKADVNQALKQGLGRTDTISTSHTTRRVLVVAEVALSLVLLVGAGLMIRSSQQLQGVTTGFDSHGVLTMTAAVAREKFSQTTEFINFFEQVLERLRTLPGVESAGVIDDIPLDMNGSHQPIAIEGQPKVPMAEQPEVDVRLISAGYLHAMHIPLLRGRDFGNEDVSGRPASILISQSMARQFWPGEDPVGKRLTLTCFSGERSRGRWSCGGCEARRTRSDSTFEHAICAIGPAFQLGRGLSLVSSDAGGTNNNKSQQHGFCGDECRSRCRRDDACARRSNNGRCSHQFSFAVAIQHASARSVCGIGSAAGGNRHLQRAVVQRAAACARNRDSSGAGGSTERCFADGRRRRNETNARRRGDWNRCRASARTSGGKPHFSGQTCRPDHLRRCRDFTDWHRVAGLRDSRIPGEQGRSSHCPSKRIRPVKP